MDKVKKYQVKLSVLLDSVNYCSDVEEDGYYVVKSTNRIAVYGEGVGEDDTDIMDDETYDFVTSEQCFHLPTWHDLEKDYPDWEMELPKRFISEKINDEKQKKQLTKAIGDILYSDKCHQVIGKLLCGFPRNIK